jgi:hypothetical protein
MNALFSNRRTRLFVTLWVILLFSSVGLTIFFFATSPVSAYKSVFGPSPAPTQENLWAFADLPKPTQTPVPVIPTIIPTDPVLPPATETPAAMTMQIVDNPSLPVSADGTGNVPKPSYSGSKYILVDLSEQHMYVYEADALIYSFVASTGINGGTRIGNFAVQSKIPNAYGSTWNIWMPNWPCLFCRTARPYGKVFWAGPFPMDVLCLVRTIHSSCTIGQRWALP